MFHTFFSIGKNLHQTVLENKKLFRIKFQTKIVSCKISKIKFLKKCFIQKFKMFHTKCFIQNVSFKMSEIKFYIKQFLKIKNCFIQISQNLFHTKFHKNCFIQKSKKKIFIYLSQRFVYMSC